MLLISHLATPPMGITTRAKLTFPEKRVLDLPRMNFSWNDKICLITGASGGIGLETSKSFLRRGAKCLMTDVNYRVS